ncbi:MAG: hypothetical protein AB1478_04485 [Nitrospirota bacterium]
MLNLVMHPKGSINYKIALAYHLQANLGHVLLQDKEIRDRLLQLDQNIEATWKEMVSIGVVRECRNCAIKDGSCCGAGMENNYDEVLLLINLLLGRTLPSQAYDTNSCYFLGENGCLLRAREVICVNYLCQRISRSIQKEKLIHLQKIAGEELNTLFMLENHIKKWIISKKVGEMMRIQGFEGSRVQVEKSIIHLFT